MVLGSFAGAGHLGAGGRERVRDAHQRERQMNTVLLLLGHRENKGMSQVETDAHMSITGKRIRPCIFDDVTKSHPYLAVVVLVFYYRYVPLVLQY
jgi:hypothetical protein